MITLHSHRSHVGPPQGPGKYSVDGQQWFDEASGQWLPVVEGQDTLCIQLEDVHATSLRAAVIARLPHHAAPTSQFVGHATSVNPRRGPLRSSAPPSRVSPRTRPSAARPGLQR